MKKITLLMALLAFFSIHAFSQWSNPLIDRFLNSSEYNRIKSTSISDFGDVDFEHSSAITGSIEGQVVINIVLAKEGVFQGVIQAIPLPAQYTNVLPGDEHYLMILYDYTAYDTLTKTGDIKLVDLNYDDWVPLEMTVTAGVMNNLNTQFMPDSIINKYSYLLKKRDLGNPIYDELTERTTHYCDLNGNGNVTFGECISCLSAACAGNQQCSVLCGIINVGGLYVGAGGACGTAMTISCVWISIWW